MIGLATVGAALTVPLLLTGAYAAVAAAVPGGVLLIQVPHWAHIYLERRTVIARLRDESGALVNIRQKHLGMVRLTPADSDDPRFLWKLQITHDVGKSDMQGWDALGMASKILARVNISGAPAKLIVRAVERIEGSTEPHHLFRELAANPTDYFGTLESLQRVDLLSLEMATHEESERRALQGELKALELAWKEAEEIAAIADSLPFVFTRNELNDRRNE